jgi:6-phosphogluconolactonase
MSTKNIHFSIEQNESSTVQALIRNVIKAIECLHLKRDFITIGLSGAQNVQYLSNQIGLFREQFKMFNDKLRFVFCDERFVPFESEESTFGSYVRAGFFQSIQVPLENVYAIDPNAPNVEKCAEEYEHRIRSLLNEQNGFDILLLSYGPDGHTCSLFPNHKLFLEADKQTNLVLPIADSPKPPPQRVTLTLPFIKRSIYLFFLAISDVKAKITREILVDKNKHLPTTNISLNSPKSSLMWFMDKEAAKFIDSNHIQIEHLPL